MSSSELTAFEIVSNASLPVQLVMLLLVVVSVLSWSMIFRKIVEYREARRASSIFEERFWSGIDLSRLYMQVNAEPNLSSGQENIFRAGFKEFVRLSQQKGTDGEAVMEGTERAMRVALYREQEKLENQLPFLATVGSTSPYIGLFGTVWGIMNSFLALAQQNQATLQVVAPDIAEALIATAIGLFAAIPAVIAFNRFNSDTERLLNAYNIFADEFSSILHRKAHSNDHAA